MAALVGTEDRQQGEPDGRIFRVRAGRRYFGRASTGGYAFDGQAARRRLIHCAFAKGTTTASTQIQSGPAGRMPPVSRPGQSALISIRDEWPMSDGAMQD